MQDTAFVLVLLLYFMSNGCVLECRHTHITGNDLIPISVPTRPFSVSYTSNQLNSRTEDTYIIPAYIDRDRYRDQIVTCDMGVSLHSKTHP